MNMNESLVANDGTKFANVKHYKSIVGGLNYLTHTRRDIPFLVSKVSRFMHSPSVHHLGAAKRILRCIVGMFEFGIWHSNVPNLKLYWFIDSDWGGCLKDRRSTSGYVFSLGSGVVSWSSKKQDIVALSSSEAEYFTTTSSACQAMWLRRILNCRSSTKASWPNRNLL
ncbi:secreted RxLR effector protein 161-like [Lactuca sativa]|uniref:secreted RxLR effector protein 161-like n=1 Tax=Lactuca sativa TaxID=4236 RepID=UPI000CD8C51B|nr:secreted RxLR effector protein 161-like [Lactuca sativa]